MVQWNRQRRLTMAIGFAGIIVEALAIGLLATDRISRTIGMPLVIAGMLVAFVPIFALSRRPRR